MCVLSNVGDYYRDGFSNRWPEIDPNNFATVSRAEFEALKKEFLEFKTLMKHAKQFDEATGQPNCEMDDKVEFVKKLAEHLDVDLEDIFGRK